MKRKFKQQAKADRVPKKRGVPKKAKIDTINKRHEDNGRDTISGQFKLDTMIEDQNKGFRLQL